MLDKKIPKWIEFYIYTTGGFSTPKYFYFIFKFFIIQFHIQ